MFLADTSNVIALASVMLVCFTCVFVVVSFLSLDSNAIIFTFSKCQDELPSVGALYMSTTEPACIDADLPWKLSAGNVNALYPFLNDKSSSPEIFAIYLEVKISPAF